MSKSDFPAKATLVKPIPFVLFVGSIFGVMGCNPSMPEFKKFEPANGKFSVLMPGTPKESHLDVASPFGQLSMTGYVSELPGNRGFSVGTSDLPKGSSFDPAKSLQGGAANVKGTVLSSSEIAMDGHVGCEGLLKTGSGLMIRSRIYLVGDRVYQVQALGNDAFVKSKDADKFLDSFKILP